MGSSTNECYNLRIKKNIKIKKIRDKLTCGSSMIYMPRIILILETNPEILYSECIGMTFLTFRKIKIVIVNLTEIL